MPAAFTPQTDHPWRQSWPPVRLYLQQQGSPDGHVQQHDATNAVQPSPSSMLSKLDNNPMSYFLAPPRPLLDYDDDDDIDDDDFSSYHTEISDIDLDMDAGIEDAAHPHPIVRAISPSALEKHGASGSHTLLRRRTASLLRPPTPPRQSARAGHDAGLKGNDDDDDDNDGDDYVRFGMAVPVSIPARTSSAAVHTTPRSSSGSYAAQSAGTRAGACPDPAGTRHLPAGGRPVRRRSPRSWRVPSPAVFPIEEENEQDDGHHRRAQPVQKQVRFVLPYEGV